MYAIPPRSINKTDIFTTFEKLNRYLCTDLRNTDDAETLRAELSQLTNSCYSKYKPSTQTLNKHGLLKRLKGNKDIVIIHAEKRNEVVIVNRKDYDKAVYDILKDNSKFKKLQKDPTLLKEGQLQCFIRTLKKQGVFNENIYENIYRVGSRSSMLDGTPKLHKSFTPLCPIV